MKCPSCKGDKIVACEIGSMRGMRDATEYHMGCPECGYTWSERKGWRGSRLDWSGVQYVNSLHEFEVMFPPKQMVFQRPQHDYDYRCRAGKPRNSFRG